MLPIKSDGHSIFLEKESVWVGQEVLEHAQKTCFKLRAHLEDLFYCLGSNFLFH